MSTMKRGVSLLLILVMVLSWMPMNAQATETPQASVDSSDVTVEGTNGFGNLLSNEIAQYQSDTENAGDYPGGYTVTDLEISGNQATVTYDSMKEAQLVVALYTEDGVQLLTSATATVSPEESQAVLTIPGTMPQYFMASAFLLDSYDYSPLCPAYDTPMYTKEMQELMASTADDYDADRVLNLDEDKTTNFAVYAEETIIIEPASGVNTVSSIDDESYTYIITNADSRITSLQPGNVFAYPYAENELLIVKVAAIQVDGTTVTITGEDLEMEEVFSVMKLENTGSTSDMIVDENSGDSGVTYTGTNAKDPVTTYARGDNAELEFSMGFNVEKEIDKYSSFSGSIGVNFKVEFEYFISWTRQFMRFEYGTETEIKLGYEFKVGAPIPKATSKLKLKTIKYSPVAGVDIGFEPEVIVEFTATVEFVCTLHKSGGFSYESGKGVRDLSQKPTIDIDIKIEGVIFFGIDFGPHISILKDNVAKVKLSSQVGLEITGKTTGCMFEDITIAGEEPESIHECELCYAIELAIKAEFSLKIKLLKSDWLSVELKLAAKRYKIGMLYYSDTYSDFGWGECPYKQYRVTVSVLDENSKGVADAVVKATRLDEKTELDFGTTNGNGVVVKYLKPDEYLFAATVEGETCSRELTVSGACKLSISLTESKQSNILGTVGKTDITDITVVGEETLNGHRYEVVDSAMTWQEAQSVCERRGGYLVTITSPEENTFIISLLNSHAKKNCYWTGLYRSSVQSPWQWVTGENYGFTNWAPNEPNNDGGKGEYYVHLFGKKYTGGRGTKEVGHWNDTAPWGAEYANEFYALSNFGFICEYNETVSMNMLEEGSSGMSENHHLPSDNDTIINPNALYPGEYDTEVSDNRTLKTASFSGLVPGGQYLLLALVDVDAKELLAPENLLYIDQAPAGEDGTLTFCYAQRVNKEVSYVIACGPSNRNLADATIIFPTMTADGQLQVVNPTVTYDGKTLTEGVDYVILGTVDYTKPGTYTCYVRGIYNYTGLVECKYTVSEEPAPAKPYKIVNVVSGVHVYWKSVPGAVKYGVWRSETGKDGTYKWLGNPTVPHFTDIKVQSGKTYYYKVTAMDTSGTHSAKSPAIGITYVSTPDISARYNKAAGVKLDWKKVTGATGYAIYRKSYSGNDAWVRVTTISGNATFTWTDTSVKNNNGTAYKYTIRALAGSNMKTLSGCRNAGRSMVRLTSRTLTDATKASATSIKCTWTTSSAVTGYEVRFMVGDQVYKTFTVGNYKTGVKTFTGLQVGQTYKIQVRSYKKIDGMGFYSAWSTAKNVTL